MHVGIYIRVVSSSRDSVFVQNGAVVVARSPRVEKDGPIFDHLPAVVPVVSREDFRTTDNWSATRERIDFALEATRGEEGARACSRFQVHLKLRHFLIVHRPPFNSIGHGEPLSSIALIQDTLDERRYKTVLDTILCRAEQLDSCKAPMAVNGLLKENYQSE